MLLRKNSQKQLKTSVKSYSWFKMAMLFFAFISFALGLGLVQSAMVSRQAFWSRVEQYLNFANPNYRFVHIYPGMRREEIIEKYTNILGWDEKDKQWFIASAPSSTVSGDYIDGYFLPKSYIVDKDASGQEVGKMMRDEFDLAVQEKVIDKLPKSKTDPEGESVISLDTAVRIASLIQREAAGKKDMGLISGIMWNRIFNGMKLDIDATLQYAKGTPLDWWPQVTGKDKYLKSPFNTYQNKGLPPAPISNPSLDAITAAYNPQKTDCLFYIHDNTRKIHCTKTYEEHKANVKKYLK
jgi:UPF0755 protein